MNLKIAGKNKTRWNVLFLFLAAAVCLLLPVPSSFCADDMIALPSKKTADKAATVEKAQPAETAPASISMLQGVFYDFSMMKDKGQNPDFNGIPVSGTWYEERVAPALKILKAFVNGNWRREYDNQGRVHYPDLDKYWCPATRVWRSFSYTSGMSSANVPQALGCNDVRPSTWCCVYSGYVKAPFTGKFRFLGFGDDFLVIRFGQQVVLDYGCYSATLGERITEEWRTKHSASGSNQIIRTMPKINEPEVLFYSSHKPDFYFPDSCGGYGVATGKVLSVRAGDVIPIDIMTSDRYHDFRSGRRV